MVELALGLVWALITLAAVHLRLPEPKELQEWTWEAERERIKEVLSDV